MLYETEDIKKSSDQSFVVILVIGSLLMSSIYFLISSIKTPESDEIPETLGESSLSVPKAPPTPVEVPKQKQQPTPPPQTEKKIEKPKEEVIPESKPEDKEEEVDDEEIEKETGPVVKLLNTTYKGKTLLKKDPVLLAASATSADKKIEKVEFYLNDKKEKSIEKRDMHTKDAKPKSDQKIKDATNKAIEKIKDEFNSVTVTHDYREFFKKDGGDCDIDQGYLIILHDKKQYYEVRVSEDLKDIEVCENGESINYYDTYRYVFKGDANNYEVYAKAYDTKDKSTKTPVIKFELE